MALIKLFEFIIQQFLIPQSIQQCLLLLFALAFSTFFMPVKRVINISLPGSKSYINRALICAAFACGRTRLFGYGECEDTAMMMEALKKMGVKIKNLKFKIKNYNSMSCRPRHADMTWHGMAKFKIKKVLEINSGIEKLRLPSKEIYVGNAGTAMRFLASLVGLAVNQVKSARQKSKVETDSSGVILTGSKRMQERPIGDLLEALGELGIRAEAVNGNGCPPLQFSIFNFQFSNNFQFSISNFQTGGKTRLRGDASSQYLSSILLCAPYFDRDTEIEIIGQLTSKPYIDMTIEMMRQFGVNVINQKYRYFKVKAGQKYKPCDYQIEPDASAASYFMAGAALTGQTVRFPGLSVNSKQGDVRFARVLNQMQNSKIKNQNVIQNSKFKIVEFVGGKRLQGIEADMNAMPDMVPTLAVLAMFAKGRTVIKNVANLRIKECDRLKALATEIRKFGVEVKELSDGLAIIGNPNLRVSSFEFRVSSYNDHRMAMAFAIAKLVIPDIIIENPGCVSKSFPGFWDEWHKMKF